MRITVKPVGVVRKYFSEHVHDALDGITSRMLIRELGIPEKLKMTSFVNGKRIGLDELLGDGDQVILVSLLTGG